MRRAKCLVFSGFTIYLFFVAAARAQSEPALPEGKGKGEFARICGQCHSVDIIITKTNTADGWAAVVDDMVSRGADGTDDELSLVIQYLAAHFGPKVKVNKASAEEISTTLDLPSADAEAIVHYRNTVGAFKAWSDLAKVPHIDIKKLEQKKDRIDFSSSQDPAGDKK
jgi:competence protein ComEA